ncbi:MAG: substrate-binding domain-containing protein [Gammaproteobacteria bacterium]|nr:substrate-binding domain-containing protein [Gammaproteobacteria bacterium]
MPMITGRPVIDAPSLLNWPLDGEVVHPNLHDPGANVLYDLHGAVTESDLLLSSEGNYHMALREVWPQVLAKFKDDPLRNPLYTTSPPVVLPQLQQGVLQFDNLLLCCKPSVVVANHGVIDKLAAQNHVGAAIHPLYQDRGLVILVQRGNPKNIRGVWDLGNQDVRLITPHPELEPGTYQNYSDAIYNIAKADAFPPQTVSAERLFDVIFNGASGDPLKWLAGPRIHHRDLPWSVAYGRADAAVMLYHIALHTQRAFPALFDIVPLGGSIDNPQPLRGTKIDTRYVAEIKGEWTPKQRAAQQALIDTLLSADFTRALEKHGLRRP